MTIEELYSLFVQHPCVTTDSRDVPEGSLFFALRGESFDGNLYAASALEKGAAYAVVDNEEAACRAAAEGVRDRLIVVDDALRTLQELARHHRCQVGTTIIGVTGTNGKTTTKELIAAVLSKRYNVLYTQGNFNNHIGVPKTLLRLTGEHDIAVVEMGANHPGEIKALADIVLPDYGIITNVGKAHLLGFGSLEGVIRTKGELYDFLRSGGGTAFINGDNPHLRGISGGLRLVKYGQGDDPDLLVRGELAECNPFLKFRWESLSPALPERGGGGFPVTGSPAEARARNARERWETAGTVGTGSPTISVTTKPSTPEGGDGGGLWLVSTRLIGSYNIDNALAAACVGTFFAVSAEDINAALEGYTPTNSRSQLMVTGDNRLVVDAYNANPTSMAAALDNFRALKAERKMCILGAMKELGEASEEEHRRVVEKLGECAFDKVWLVGEEFGSDMTHRDIEAVRAAIAAEKPRGYTILIKGSNSTRLTQAVELL